MNNTNLPFLFLAVTFASLARASAHNASFPTFDLGKHVQDPQTRPNVLSVERKPVTLSFKAVANGKAKEKTTYAVEETHLGYARLMRTGVTVRLGVTASMTYHMRFKGISAEKLARQDWLFVKTLSKSERRKYFRKKRDYSGDLGVTFLRFLGIHLSDDVTKASMDRAARRTRQYNRKAYAARAILNRISNASVSVSGHVTAVGVGFFPASAFAFVEVARVRLVSGRFVTVISGKKSAVRVRTAGGKQLPTVEEELVVEDEDDLLF